MYIERLSKYIKLLKAEAFEIYSIVSADKLVDFKNLSFGNIREDFNSCSY